MNAHFLLLCTLLAASDTPIRQIIDAYGGKEHLQLLRQYTAEGRICVVSLFSSERHEICTPQRIYRLDPYQWREEVGPDYEARVTVYHENEGIQFCQGTRLYRTMCRLSGQDWRLLPSGQVRYFWELDRRSVTNFLLEATQLQFSFDGLQQTVEGKPAWTYSVIYNGFPTRYYFDPLTKLCVQQTVVHRKGYTNALFSDYRDVQGLQYPFHVRRFNGDRLVSESFIDAITPGQPLNVALFRFPPPRPKWLLPLVASSIVLIFVVVVIVTVIRRLRAHPTNPIPRADARS